MSGYPHKTAVRFLRLVGAKPEARALDRTDFVRPAWQNTLFAMDHSGLLIFVNFESVSEADFLAVLTDARPRHVFDLRLVPRFDVGSLNRRLVFSIFAQSSTQYSDLSGRLGDEADRDLHLRPQALGEHLLKTAFAVRNSLRGPITFLVDNAQFQESYISGLASVLQSPGDKGWDVLRVPQAIPGSGSAAQIGERRRDVVFISHANPEDSAFALWLASHLACAGYSVWSDVTKLLGGELFWDTIEDRIRYDSAKVIVALSRKAQLKQGVLDEVNLAVSVERVLGLRGFVVPIRIDDLPLDQVRANLARKNVIDFCANWATGLARLLESFERDGVPRANVRGATDIGAWCKAHLQSRVRVARIPEPLLANWLRVLALPEWILFHQIDVPLERINDTIGTLGYPHFRHLRLVGGFAEAEDFQSSPDYKVRFAESRRIPLQRFLAGQPDEFPSLEGRQARNFVTSLFRQAWDREAAKRGLRPYETASGAVVWFVPKSLIEDDRVHFSGESGKRRSKLLVGRSERRQVYWHFGIEAKPALGRVPRMVLRPHVIFSADGVSPLESKVRMHVLRRSFCKNWWNDRWRDLIFAFVSWFAGGDEVISLPLGRSATLDFSSSLLKIEAPVSTEGETPGVDATYELPDELDAADILDDELVGPDYEWLGDGEKVDGEPE